MTAPCVDEACRYRDVPHRHMSAGGAVFLVRRPLTFVEWLETSRAQALAFAAGISDAYRRRLAAEARERKP